MIKISYLNQKQSQDFDNELMSPQIGFKLEQLMELAGQSVANCAHHIISTQHNQQIKKILLIAGPGNNGGDAMVAARHLQMYNGLYKTNLLIFKDPERELFQSLIQLCKINGVEVRKYQEVTKDQTFLEFINSFEFIIDGIFGFSFKPPSKQPYTEVLESFKQIKSPIFSIDIPSGWDVEKGNTQDLFNPQYLISLTLPKIGCQSFQGKHYLGGRFVPQQLAQKYGFVIPEYQGNNQFVEI